MTLAPQLREDPIEGDRAACDLVETAGAHIKEHWGDYLSHDLIADYAQSAYETLLTKYRDGEEIAHPKAYIKKIAHYLARNRIVWKNPDLVDPTALAADAVGESPEPAEEITWRSDIANVAAVVDQLTEYQQAVYRAVFVEHLSVRQAATQVGRSKSSVERTMRELHQHFEGILSATGEDAAKVKILTAYAFGDASVRRAAEILLKNDPTAASILRGIRGAHEGAAALVPPVLLETDAGSAVFQRFSDGVEAMRERLGGGTDHSAVTEAAGQLASSGAGRGTGAAAGGTLATITGLLGTKGAALCAGGAAAAACVGAFVAPGLGPSNADERPERPSKPAAAVDDRPPEPPRGPVVLPAEQADAPNPHPGPTNASPQGDGGGGDGAGGEAPAPVPASAPTPANPSSPTDPGTYNPYNAASPTPPPAPAPASSPTSGGGSSGGGCNPYDSTC